MTAVFSGLYTTLFICDNFGISRATVTVDSEGRLIETQEVYEGEKNVPSVTTRFIEGGKLITTEQAGDVVSKRVFTRA